MSKQLIIIGGEGKGGSVAACVEDNRRAFGNLEFAVAGFINDYEIGNTILGYPVLGGTADIPRLLDGDYYFFHSVHLIGRNYQSAAFFERLQIPEERLASIVSQRAYVAHSARLAAGVCVMPGACVSHMVELGLGVMVMANATLTHHSRIGPLGFVAIGSIVGSYVEIGRGASVALGATVIEHAGVGDYAVLAAASLLNKTIPEGEIWAGTPARFLREVHK